MPSRRRPSTWNLQSFMSLLLVVAIALGVFENYPGIGWIFAHAGDTLPYLSFRMSLGAFTELVAGNVPDVGRLTTTRAPTANCAQLRAFRTVVAARGGAARPHRARLRLALRASAV